MQKQNYEIEITLFLIDSILVNRDLCEDFSRAYEQYKYDAYKKAKESEYYNHYIIVRNGIEREIYAKKILGLLLLAEEDESLNENLSNLIKLRYPKLYKFVKSQKLLRYSEMLPAVGWKGMSTDEINAICLFSYLFAKENDIEVDIADKAYVAYIEVLNGLTDFHFNNSAIKAFSYKTLSEDLKKVAKDLKDRVGEKYGNLDNISEMLDIPKDDELKKYVEILLMLIETENFAFEKISDYVNKNDVNEICALYYILYKNKNVENSIRFIVVGVLFKYILKEYKKVKEYYFKNNKETLYLNMQEKDEKINSLQKENNELKNELERLKKENEYYKTEYSNTIIKENENLKKTIIKQEKEIEKLNENNQELFELRNYVFEQDQFDIDDIKIENKELPTDIKILIVGGYANWRNQLKDIASNNISLLPGDNPNFDISILNNLDIILFNVAGMKHKTYYKIVNVCRTKNIKFHFIKNQNINNAINEICSKLV